MSTTSIQPFERDQDTYNIIGAAMAVHRELGCGYLEAVYKGALAIEFRLRSIPFWPEVALPIDYKGERLPTNYRVDFVCGPDPKSSESQQVRPIPKQNARPPRGNRASIQSS